MPNSLTGTLPQTTRDQLDELGGEYGLTPAQIVTLAIHRLHRHLLPDDYRAAELTAGERVLVECCEPIDCAEQTLPEA